MSEFTKNLAVATAVIATGFGSLGIKEYVHSSHLRNVEACRALNPAEEEACFKDIGPEDTTVYRVAGSLLLLAGGGLALGSAAGAVAEAGERNSRREPEAEASPEQSD